MGEARRRKKEIAERKFKGRHGKEKPRTPSRRFWRWGMAGVKIPTHIMAKMIRDAHKKAPEPEQLGINPERERK